MSLRCLAGNFHQGCDLFRNAGAQCTAIAYFAIVVIFLNSHFQGGSLDNYTHQVINETIIQGNQMYENSIQEISAMQILTFPDPNFTCLG